MLRNFIAMTIENTMEKLGPIPGKHGDLVKSIMSSGDEDNVPKIFALGCYMEDCEKVGNYDPLDDFQKELDELRNRGE